MPSKRKASNEELIASYAETKSVWKTAEVFNMCGQSVHERLQKLGLITPINVFTDEEISRIKKDYATYVEAGKLPELAKQMNRAKTNICKIARQLGLTNTKRKKAYSLENLYAGYRNMIATKGHPRGMLGHAQSDKCREAVSKSAKARWAAFSPDERNAFVLKKVKSRLDKGPIGGVTAFFRSRWEANYARYLEKLRVENRIKAWEHEPHRFWFPNNGQKNLSYLPDFRVTLNSGTTVFREVKGWIDTATIAKAKLMVEHYPDTIIKTISKNEYERLERLHSSSIPDWEFP